MNVLGIIAAAGLCACFAFLGTVLGSSICDGVLPFEDGPRPSKTSIPLLVTCAALLGAAIALRGVTTAQLGLIAILCLSLSAIWYSDVRSGIVPDVFTLGPLVAILGAAIYLQQWSVLVSSLVIFLPFACAALLSKGRGMGWGDAKLVALGGAVLGMETALLSFGIACAAAVIVALVRKRSSEPIAFAPYLVLAIALSTVARGIT